MSSRYTYLDEGFRTLVGKDFEAWKAGRNITPGDLAEAMDVALGPPETMYYLCDHTEVENRYEGHFQEDYIGQWCPGLIETEGWGII